MREARRLAAAGALSEGSGVHDDGTLVEGLLDGLLSAVLPEPPGPVDAVARALEAHREHARAWYGDLIGPLGVPASAAGPLVDALRSSDHGLPIVLLGPWPTGPAEPMHGPRAQLLDDDRVQLTGVELSMPPAVTPAEAARLALADLDIAAGAWLRIPPDPSWIDAVAVIAEDGAERAALELPASTGPADCDRLAAVVQALVSRGRGFCVVVPPGAAAIDLITHDSAFGLLNLICAVGSAIEAAIEPAAASVQAGLGGEQARLSGLLADTGAGVIQQARRIGPRDAAAIRGLLDRVSCGSIRALIGDLEAAGLIVADVA